MQRTPDSYSPSCGIECRVRRALGYMSMPLLLVATTVVACERDADLTDPSHFRNPVEAYANKVVDSTRMQKLRDTGEGCAVSAADVNGVRRGFAIPRKLVPFKLPAIQMNPQTGRGNGRVAHIVMRRTNGSPVSFDCWVANNVPIKAAATTAKDSRDSVGLAEIFERLEVANALPAANERIPSAEAEQFASELLAPDSLANIVHGHGAISMTSGGTGPAAPATIPRKFIVGCDSYATDIRPSRPTLDSATTPVRALDDSGCSCFSTDIEIWYDGSSWHFEVDFSFCSGSSGGDYPWMVENNYWAWECGGTTADERDKLIAQYHDSTYTWAPHCGDLQYQPSSTTLAWSVVQSHSPYSPFPAYDPFFNYAIYRSAAAGSLEALRADTNFTLGTGNRIYSTPHHNNLRRCYKVDSDFSLKPACDPQINSRHIYGDAADIQSRNLGGGAAADTARWLGLRIHAYGLYNRPCGEPMTVTGVTHVHIDWRVDTYAFARWTACPANYTITATGGSQ